MVALRSFIDAFDAEGLQQVKPLIPQLLDVFFQLMQEVGGLTVLCSSPLQQLAVPLADIEYMHALADASDVVLSMDLLHASCLTLRLGQNLQLRATQQKKAPKPTQTCLRVQQIC